MQDFLGSWLTGRSRPLPLECIILCWGFPCHPEGCSFIPRVLRTEFPMTRKPDPTSRSQGQDATRSQDPPEVPGRDEFRKRTPVIEEFEISQRIQRWLTETDVHGLVSHPPAYSPEDQHDFRPRLRPAVPILTVLDDGLRDFGEDHRLRGEVTTIGRRGGDIQIPNDVSMSHLHAEVRRTTANGVHHWQLRDAGSTNGTFVRCQTGTLHDQAIAIIGSRRFRLRNPLRPNDVGEAAAYTQAHDFAHLPETIWPILEETTERDSPILFPLKFPVVSIGRRGGGADIELDDPLLADRHATLKRLRDGSWAVLAEKTRNGVWVSITAIGLTRHCFFRCGEQQFRFLMT
jgi:pSer/pThr/pTyr-binding forkhead associated (FHA) protein